MNVDREFRCVVTRHVKAFVYCPRPEMAEILSDKNGLMTVLVSAELVALLGRLRWSHSYDQTPRIRPGQTLFLRDDAPLAPYVGFYKGFHVPQIGAFSYSASPLNRSVTLGAYCSISWNVAVMGGNHPLDRFSTTGGLYTTLPHFKAAYDDLKLPVHYMPNPQKPMPVIGNDVWIGQDVLLANGITIGDGAVIAAGSVIVKDVLPYEIVGGAPAKHIRFRFAEEERTLLSRSRWWNFHLPTLAPLAGKSVTAFTEAVEHAVLEGRAYKISHFPESLADLVRTGQVVSFLKEDGRKLFQSATPADIY